MKFIGMAPLQECFPNVEIESNGASFDLHNAGILDSVEYSHGNRVFVIRWKVKSMLECTPSDQSNGIVALVFHGVRQVRGEGVFATTKDIEDTELDVVHYVSLPNHLGEVQFDFMNGATVNLIAECCEFRLTRGEVQGPAESSLGALGT